MKNLVLVLMLLGAQIAWAETAFVVDNVNAKLRSGKGENYRTLRVLPAKTEVDILEPDEEFAKVKTADGQVGWIKSSLLRTQKAEGKDVQEVTVLQMPVQEPPVQIQQGQEGEMPTAASQPAPIAADKSYTTLLTVALLAFLAGVAVGAAALRAYYLKRLHGLRI